MAFLIGTVATGAVDARFTAGAALIVHPVVLHTGDVNMTAHTGLTAVGFAFPIPPIGVVLIFEGGPLDGEIQVVENTSVPTVPGAPLTVSVPNYQTFDPAFPDEEIVVSQGLIAIYAFVGPGPSPESWVFNFTGQAYVPPTKPLPPLPPPSAWVLMTATTTLVPDTEPVTTSPSVTMGASAGMQVDATVTRVKNGVVALSGETSVSVTPDWTPRVDMAVIASIDVEPT